jgi:spore coat polysaccharide biosynthesis predicted glycosyltransferase SpsG
MLLVADAGAGAGLGHLTRSSALAVALRSRGLELDCVAFGASSEVVRAGVSWRPEGLPEAIVELAATSRVAIVDSYNLPATSLDSIVAASRVVLMHDVGEPHPGAALVVAPSDPGPARPGWLTGLEHACLGRAFAGLPAPRLSASVDTVLVTTGGGDPGGRAGDLAAAAARALPQARIRLVRGPQAPAVQPGSVELIGPLDGMVEALSASDLVVCGAGGTMLEACAVGAPTLAMVLAPNQAGLAAAAVRACAVELLDGDAGDGEDAIRALAGDRPRRGRLSEAARVAVDGLGAERVAIAVERLNA